MEKAQTIHLTKNYAIKRATTVSKSRSSSGVYEEQGIESKSNSASAKSIRGLLAVSTIQKKKLKQDNNQEKKEDTEANLDSPDVTFENSPEKIRHLSVSELTFKSFKKVFNKHHSYEKSRLPGYSMVVEIVSVAYKAGTSFNIPISILFGLIRALIPLVTRVIEGNPPLGARALEGYLSISVFIITFIFFMFNFLIASVSVNDMGMKIHMLGRLSNLLPKERNQELKRKFPPLNIFDPISLRTWETFDVILMDYGNRFQARHNVNLTCFLVIYLIQLIFIILRYLNFIQLNIDIATVVIACFEVRVAMILFVALLFRGAKINQYFMTHRLQLLEIKGIFSDMNTLKSLYFGEDPIEPDCQRKLQGIKYFQQIFDGQENYMEKCSERLEQLEKITDRMIEQLSNREINEPFKLFRIKVDYGIIKALGTGVVTLGAAIAKVQTSES